MLLQVTERKQNLMNSVHFLLSGWNVLFHHHELRNYPMDCSVEEEFGLTVLNSLSQTRFDNVLKDKDAIYRNQTVSRGN